MNIGIFSAFLEPETLVCYFVDVPEDLNVKQIIQRHVWAEWEPVFKRDDVALGELKIKYHNKGVAKEPLETLPQRLRDLESSMRMLEYDEIISQLERCDKDHVQMILHIPSQTPAHETPQSLNPAEEAFGKVFARLALLPAPSSFGNVSTFLNHQQTNEPIYNGRPGHLHTTPLALYHPAFATLKNKLSDLSQVSHPSSDQLALTSQLVSLASDVYRKNADRQAAMISTIEELLAPFDQEVLVREWKSNHPAVHADFLRRLSFSSPRRLCVPVAGIFKVELEEHIQVQAAMKYGLLIAQPDYEWVRKATCSPAFVLSFAGPYLNISGVAIVDVLILQSFTDLVHLDCDRFSDTQLVRVAKIFDVLREAILELETYYTNLKPSVSPDLSRLMPKPNPGNGEDISERLVLRERVIPNVGYAKNRPSLFRGTWEGKPVLVKFCERYNHSAHELLAKHDPALAPPLYFFSEVQCRIN